MLQPYQVPCFSTAVRVHRSPIHRAADVFLDMSVYCSSWLDWSGKVQQFDHQIHSGRRISVTSVWKQVLWRHLSAWCGVMARCWRLSQDDKFVIAMTTVATMLSVIHWPALRTACLSHDSHPTSRNHPHRQQQQQRGAVASPGCWRLAVVCA